MSFKLSTGSTAIPSASATVSSNAAETATITVTAGCYLTNGWVLSTGVVARIYINGSLVSTKTILGNGISYSAPNKKTVTASKIITKKNSSQNVAWYVEFWQYTDNTPQNKKTTISGTKSISAKTSYTVSYNANGGSGAPSTQKKWYGEALTLSRTKPTRTGHVFQEGWATSSTGGISYASGAKYEVDASVTLYAVWKANTYTVSYNANGGSGAPSSQIKTYGKTLTLSPTKPTRTNYTFLGWSASKTSTTATYTEGSTYTANSSTTLYAVWKLAYTKPRIDNLSIKRCGHSGDTSVTPENAYAALLTFNWSTFMPVSEILIEWKSASSGSGSRTITASGKTGSANEIIIGLNPYATFTFTVTVTDDGGSLSRIRYLNSVNFIIDLLSGGNGVAFGKTAERSGYAEFGFKTFFNNNATFNNNVTIRGINAKGVEVEALIPVNGNGNTVLGYGNYDNGSGNTHVYGYDINFGISNVASGSTIFKPYYNRGDSLEVAIQTAGYTTNSGKDVVFWIPLSKPLIGSPTVTATSINGFTLRQGAKYTHGSSATVNAKPSSYSVAITHGYGMRITAVFSNVSNVTNNDSIGITWSGKITFS